MSKNTIEIQEDDLHAYVDQQLSAEKVEAVETLMRKDPQIAQQVHDWKKQNEAISTLFDKDAFTEIPEQLNLKRLNDESNKKIEKAQRTPWFYSMAASVFFMALSGTIGWFAHDLSQSMTPNTTNFINSAISAHQVYTVEVLHPVEVNADKQKHLVAWLSKRIDHPLAVPNLQDYGYNLLGGRLLAMRKGRAAAQLMFENKEGKRVTLLVSKNPSYRDQAFHLKKESDLNAFYWMDSSVAYSIASKTSPEALRKLSKSVYEQLNEKRPKQVACAF